MLVARVLAGLKDLMETLVLWAQQDDQDQQEPQGELVCLVFKVPSETLDLQEHQALPDPAEHQETRDLSALREIKDLLEIQDQGAHRVSLV